MPDKEYSIPVFSDFSPEENNIYQPLKTLQGAERKKYIETLRSLGYAPPKDDGVLGEIADSTAESAVGFFKGVGEAVRQAGMGDAVADYFQGVLNRNRQWTRPEELSVGGYIGRGIGGGVGTLAATLPTMAADALLGTKGAITASALFSSTFGENLKRNRSVYDNESKAVGLAALESGVDTSLEFLLGTIPMLGRTIRRLGPAGKQNLVRSVFNEAKKDLGAKGAKRFFLDMARNGLEEGTTGGLQYLNSWTVRALGNDPTNEFNLQELIDNTAMEGIGGMFLGGVNSLVSRRSQGIPPVENNTDIQNSSAAPVAPVAPVAPETPVAPESVPLTAPETVPAPEVTPESVRLVDEVAKELGLNVRYFDEEGAPPATDAAGNDVNGWYDSDKNEFWINRQDPQMSPLEILGHEFKHYLDNKHSDLAKAFNDVMTAGINEAGRQELQKTETDYTDAGYKNRGMLEFSADTMGKLWTDPQFWQDVAVKAESLNAGMGERMLKALQEFIRVVQRKLKEIGTPEAKQLFDNMKELRAEAVRIAAEVKARRNAADMQIKADAELAKNAKGNVELPEVVDVDALQIDPDRFQFKENKDKSGVVTPLQGNFDQQVARPVFVWEDKDGKRFVVEGHHRLDLAKRSGTKQLLAYVHKEADGKTADWARRRGIMMNIQDNKGSIKDFASFFREDDITYDEAKKRGLFRDAENGEIGFIIGKYSGDTLYSAFRNDDITPEKAAIIADAARGDEGLEAAGLKKADGMSKEHLTEYMKLLKKLPREKNEQGDLFGFDDSAIQEADKVSKLALKHQKELRGIINSGKGAIKNPVGASKTKVSIDKESGKLLEDLKKELNRYEHYDTDPEIYQQLLQEAGLAPKETAEQVVPTVRENRTAEEDTATPKENLEVASEVVSAENAQPTTESVSDETVNLSRNFRDIINSDKSALQKKIDIVKLGQENGLSPKEIEERCEAEIVSMAREINNENISDSEKYQKLVELYNKQPSFNKRTSTSVANQAYSTPVPLAWALGKRIGLIGNTVYEPTAGTGMLTIAGDPATITVNEIDVLRKGVLETQGFAKVTSRDASTGKPNQKFDRVIMNPPFGAGKETRFGEYKLTKLDHIIAANALETMKNDGKAAIIIGANTEQRGGQGKANYADHVFRSYLYSNFNVKDDFIVDGQLYRKQGASYPVRVITVSGKKSVADTIEAPQGLEIINDWSTLYDRLQGEIENEISATERNTGTYAETDTVAERPTDAEGREGRASGDRGPLGKDSGNTQGRSGRSSGRSAERHESESGRSRGVVQDRSARGRVSEPAEPGSDNRSRMGDSTADIHGQPERDGNNSGSVADRGRSASTGRESSVRTERRPDESSASPQRVQVGEKRGELNNSYVPASKSTDKMDVVVPRFMAEALEDSLSKVESEVGPIDKFVQDELGYDTSEELYRALSDVQIDGVAQAIHAVKNNTGFVLGDQTGIGKGRQCAAMIRWAQKHGVIPVFFTRDQNLFTDMYRDGNDIGTKFNPLIIASDAGKANINDQDGKKIIGIPKNLTAAFDGFLKEKSEYDCVFCPYSQLSKEGKQREFLKNLVSQRKCLFIMDEAHEASGDSSRGRFFYGEGGILRKSFVNVVYASATFAKRPDNMALYFRTNIKDAVDNIDNLQEVLSKGGVPLQQLLSANLARDGQYTRRERDFTGVNFDTVIAELDENSREELVDRFDRVAHVLSRMIRYSEMLKETINKAMKNTYGSANTREKQSVSMASFSSITHNYISQLLLASKCDIIVQEAEKAFKAGQKPVIALTNTLESVLSEFVSDNGIGNGEPLSMRFSDILESALLRMYKFTQKTGKGEKITQVINPSDFGLDAAHETMLNVIHDLDDIALPVSPIDYIKHQLAQKGIKTGEITGRKQIVDYSTAVPTLASRSSQDANKNKNVNDFNSGKTDAIILNASGSTGLSLHSSVKFADQKQRNMIMAQPSLDIAVVQQMFGRVLRSGQVNSPVYKILSSPLAAERRPMMVLSRKLQSLNANTTANNKGAVSLGLDFMNKYGDLVAQQFLDDNPDIALELDLDSDSSKTSEATAPDGLITKLTGRMAVLSDSQQQDVLDDLVSRYSNLIDFLKKTGNYDLEITVHDDWDAVSSEESVVMDGDPDGSMFKQPVVLKKINIKEMRNVRSLEDVQNDIKENFGDDVTAKLQSDFAKAEEGIENLEKSYLPGEKPLEFINDRKTLLYRTLNDFKNFVQRNNGRMLEIQIGEDSYTGMLTGYHVVGKYSDRSPVVASKIMLDFAVTDTVGKISIPYSRFQGQGVTYSGSFINARDAFTGEQKAVRTDRYAVTGNLLRGLEYTEAGKVVSYKTSEGNVESALLLPKTWEPSKFVRDPRNEIQNVDEAMEQLNGPSGVLRSGDGLVIISRYGRTFIDVPRAKNKGGKYYLDEKLLEIIDGDFTSYGRVMRSPNLSDKQIRAAIEHLLKMEDVYLKKDSKEYSLQRDVNIDSNVSEPGIQYSLRRKPSPQKTVKAYKLFRVDESGKPHALFIDSANPLSINAWYDADAPAVDNLKNLEVGNYYVDKDGKVTSCKKPGISAIKEAALNGGRYIGVKLDGRKGWRYGQKLFFNWGINGSGTVAPFAMRPGWHATNAPTARHIGAAENNVKKWRRPDERWFEIEMAADIDYHNEASKNPDGDIPDHIPQDGLYSFRTNTNADESQVWYITGSIKINKPLSENEAKKIANKLGYQEDLPYKDGVKNFKEYSLRRHDQVNPIRESGAIKDEYQEKLDNDTFASRSNAEVNRRARNRIALLGGMKATAQMIIDGDITGTSDVGQRVMQLVLNSPEYKAMDVSAREKIADVYTNNAGTEIARALAARRLGVLKLDDIQSIQAHINVLLAKLDKLKPKNTIRKDILDEFGIDIETLPDDIIENPERLDALVRKLASQRASVTDKAYEFWINAILSGPGTHSANIAGNVINAAYELGVKRFVEAAINVAAKKKDGATFGEFKQMRQVIDWKNAYRKAKLAFELETIGSDMNKLENVRLAIGGKAGRIIRTPGRLLRAADEFAKAVIQPMEAAAYAYRQGKQLKLSGAKLQEFIQNQLTDTESRANEYGSSRAVELTFQNAPGNAVKQLIRWRESGGVMGTILKFAMPFLRTPSNIIRQGVRKSHLGVVSLAWETGKAMLGKRNIDNDYIGQVAEQVIAWGALMAFMSAFGDDDDLPIITGTSPRYGSAEQKFKAQKLPPYSIRIGDSYYSYKRIEPLSTGLAFMADGINAYRAAKNGEDGTKILKKLLGGVKQIIVEKSYLDSLGEINRVVSDPDRSAAKFLTNFAASWMPNVVRQTVNAFDDNVRDTKSRSKGAEWWEDQFQIVTDRMGFTKAAPKLDYFGRPIKKDDLEESGILSLARLLPTQRITPADNMNQAEQLMWNWNNNNPGKEYYPDVPAYYFQRNKKKYYFARDDYQQFVRESGQLALRQINNAFRHGLLNMNNPKERDIKLIKSIFAKSRQLVRDKMFYLGQYSE